MKHLITTVVLILLAAAATSVATFKLSADPAVKAAVERRDVMQWLRTDFNLTDAQYAKIKHLHDAYSVVCEKHCQEIMEAARGRNALKAAPSPDAAALAAAEKRLQELRVVCETAIAAHVRQCAAEMSPASRDRYLALVLPKIADFDHQAAPDVQLNKHNH